VPERARPRGRKASFALILLLVIVGCGAEPQPRATGPTLYLAGDGVLWVVDAATGHVRREARSQLAAGGSSRRVLARGDRVVLRGSFGDSAFFLPSVRPDRVWVIDVSARTTLVRSVREVTADGVTTLGASTPPGGRRPLRAVADGLLLDDGDDLEVWDPASGRIVRHLAVEPGALGPASARLLTSCADPGCGTLLLTDTRTDAARTVGAPPGVQFEPWRGAFSPDGRLLGLPVRDSTFGSRRLAIVDVARGRAAVVPGSAVPAGYTFVAWSETGRHVFLTGGERSARRAVVAYRLGTPRAEAIDVRVGDFYDVAAI